MTSIPEHLEDKNSIYQRLRWHFFGQMNKQLSVIGIKMEIDIRMPSHNLTQRSGV